MTRMQRRRAFAAGFTLVEMSVALLVSVVVAGLAYAFLRTGTLLFAKNIAVNMSNTDLRNSLDQIADRVQSAVNVPVLITSGGAVATATPAAGVYYDRLLGEPYVLTHPGGSGLSAAASTVAVTRSTSVYASPPIPQAGDVLLIDGAPPDLRPRVSSVTTAAAAGGLQTSTVTLAAALGSAISWDAAQAKTAMLVRREALIVMPGGVRPTLRRYHSFETTTNLNTASGYTIISRQVGNVGAEPTPFSIVTAGLDRLLNIDFRVRATGFENALANKEANSFSGFMRVQSMVPSRLRPQN